MPVKPLVACSICKRQLPRNKCVPGIAVRAALVEVLRQEQPDWSPEGFVCYADLNRLRARHVQLILTSEGGSLTHLEEEVAQSFKDEQLITLQLKGEGQEPYTLGQRMADKVASFGGSWRFLITFASFIAIWIAGNVAIMVIAHAKAFDPYPFILLNLILSCLASVQAPIIMMSQNRQEARDRTRAENDYKINLKAELEIRNLHEKFDHLLEHQWQHLMEIQQIQVDLMEELTERKSI